MPVFDFHCEVCNRIVERFVTHFDHITHCDECGREEVKLLTKTNFTLDGCDPGFPTAWDRWATRHEKAAKVK